MTSSWFFIPQLLHCICMF